MAIFPKYPRSVLAQIWRKLRVLAGRERSLAVLFTVGILIVHLPLLSSLHRWSPRGLYYYLFGGWAFLIICLALITALSQPPEGPPDSAGEDDA